MLRNYIKVALRNIKRHKGYAFVNITGLAVGMACCLLLSIYVIHELNYDRCYADSDRIYRVITYKQTKVEEIRIAAASPLLLPVFREECSEVEGAFSISDLRPTIVRSDAVSAIENRIGISDDDIFNVLGLRFIYGQPAGSLARPRTAVLTEAIAHKYFGSGNPVGLTLQIDTIVCEITGVVADQPTNTHLKFTILCSSATKMRDECELPPLDWGITSERIYVKLAVGADPAAFAARIRNLPTERGGNRRDETGEVISFTLQPITDMHLSPALKWDVEPPGNPIYVFGMAATALLVLLIACVNFLNLNIARTSGRAREVGIRKAAGAHRPQLFWQFLGESLLLSLCALVAGVSLAELAIPLLSATTGIPFSYRALFQPHLIAVAIAAVLAVSLTAGSYPALFLSRLQPAQALKNRSLASFRRRMDLRKALVVGQLIVVGILVVGVVTVYRQMQFMRTQPLGFDKEQRLVIELTGEMVDQNNYQTIKQTFMMNPAVLGATISTSVPSRWNYQWRTLVSGKEAEGYKRVNWYGIDGDFLEEYGIEMVAGGPAHKAQTGIGGLLVNEAAVRTFGWGTNEQAIGQRLNDNPVIGIIKDFHFRGLQSAVEPLAMFWINEDYRYLSLRLDVRDLPKTMTALEATFKKLFPAGVFNYFFLDGEFDAQYRNEANMVRISAAFTIVGIVVAYLGLRALVVFLTQVRTKEIGIRKVFGATTPSVVLLLLAEFVPLLMAAAAVSTFAAYLIVDKWLQQFAYRIDNDLSAAIGLALTALVLMGASISIQAIKAARANPIDSLRYE